MGACSRVAVFPDCTAGGCGACGREEALPVRLEVEMGRTYVEAVRRSYMAVGNAASSCIRREKPSR
ncbi:unnamed protein product, partial [Lota lota]